MNRLDEDTIRYLLNRICEYLTDDRRQTVIDQLGMHPVNHAIFARLLTKYGHANDWQVYLDLTKSL